MFYFIPIRSWKSNRVLHKTFETIKDTAIKLEHSKYSATFTLYNIALFFLLAERDLQTLKIDAMLHPNPLRRNLALRTVLLTFCEWDMDKVSGKKLRSALNELKVKRSLRKEIEDSLAEIRAVKSTALEKLKPLRNATIAHRDADALFQYRTIRNLQSYEIMKLMGDFYDASNKFMQTFPKVITEGTSVENLLKQQIK